MIIYGWKILLLLWLINLAPPLLAHFLEDQWNRPIDGGRTFADGRPLFGSNKTLRGILGATVTGLGVGLVLGFPWWVGLFSAILSMAGDLLSSFVKRRLGQPSGTLKPGLDQIFEGLFPFAVLVQFKALPMWMIIGLVLVFCSGAHIGSWFFRKILLTKPVGEYPRPVRSRVRFRELRRCHIPLTRFHYWLNLEDVFYYQVLMKTTFRLLGIYEKGMRNALQIEKREISLGFSDLPNAFDGYTILFMSDLHLDGLDGLTERLQTLLQSLPADLCLIGGDLRMETYGPHDEALARTARLIPHITVRDGIYGVLGNHDCIEMIEPLKTAGLDILVNEAVAIGRGEVEKIWIVGLDDPHHYQCHDLDKALEDVPPGAFVILLCHSPEVYREAQQHGVKCYLCGHTHAGQIQILPIGPIFTHSRTGRRYVQGLWEYGNVQGYTSAGAGVSGVPVRFFSAGEVVRITLRKRGAAGVHR